MALMLWKVVARKKKAKTNHIKYIWENNLKAVKKQLKRDGYKFVCLADEDFALMQHHIEKEGE